MSPRETEDKKIDFFCVIVAVLGTSIPDFIMGAVLQYTFGIKWGLFPVARYEGIEYTILPACALAFYTLASVSRIMRASMLEVTVPGLHQDGPVERCFGSAYYDEASDP